MTWTPFPAAARAEIRARQRAMQSYVDGLLIAQGVDTDAETIQIHPSGLAWRIKPAEPEPGEGKLHIAGNFTAADTEPEAV